MTTFQRIRSIVAGLVMIVAALIVIFEPEIGIFVAAIIFSVYLLVYGIRRLIYFFTMARHMVGGRTMLYLGVVILDLAIFTLSLMDAANVYIMIYLIAIHGFSGVVDILRAFEARKYHNHWKMNFLRGIGNLLIAIACGVFIGSPETAAVIFGAGLIYSGIMRIVSALRRTAIIYIP